MATKKEWEQAKIDYVTDEASLTQLQRRLGVTKKTLLDRVAAEQWNAARTLYWRDVTNKALGERRGNDVEKLAKLAEACDKFDGVIAEFIEKNKFYNALDIMNIAKAMESAVSVRRDLYDIPRSSELHAQDISERRLKLDESKAEASVNPPVVRIIMDNAGTDDLNG